MVSLKKYYFLAIIIAALLFAGCNSTETNPSKKLSENNSKTENVQVTVVNLEAEQTANKGSRSNKKVEKTTTTLIDGSQYVMMKDAYGNKTEIRYFEPTTAVKYISVETMTDGASTTLVRTWDGDVKRVNLSQIANPWQSSAREIALLAGVSTEYRQAPEAKYVPPVSNKFSSPAKPNTKRTEIQPEQTSKPNPTLPVETPDASKLQKSLGNIR
jgi:hypothetical protein